MNRPNVTKDNISFGPAVVYVGNTGATPSTDFGAVGENGITVEFTQEVAEVRQGNPGLLELPYVTKQDVEVTIKGLEWSVDTLKRALGTATTSTESTTNFLKWGGDPKVDEVALKIVHKMPQTGHTIEFYVWDAAPVGGLSFEFTQEAHVREYKYRAVRAATNWAGTTLGEGEELVKVAIIA